MPLRTLTVSVGLLATATMLAAPVQADATDDTFLNALDQAGLSYEDPGSMVDLGKSVCPMLVQPGESFATTASKIVGNNGISPAMAGMVTSIAISMYCPSMLDSLSEGEMPNIPGLSGIPGLSNLSGLSELSGL